MNVANEQCSFVERTVGKYVQTFAAYKRYKFHTRQRRVSLSYVVVVLSRPAPHSPIYLCLYMCICGPQKNKNQYVDFNFFADKVCVRKPKNNDKTKQKQQQQTTKKKQKKMKCVFSFLFLNTLCQ